MNETIPHPKDAADLLARGSELTATIAEADNSRRRIYLLWAALIPFGMLWFDVAGEAVGGVVIGIAAAIGGILTAFIAQRAEVHNQAMMKSYFVVMAFFLVYWIALVMFVGPWLAEELSFGWTLTGVLGALPFLAGYFWDRRK